MIVNTGPKRVMRARKRSRCSICIKPVTPGRRSHTCRTGCRDSSGCTSAASLRSRCDGRFETTPTIGARSRDRDLRAALSGRHRLCHSQVLSLLSPALLGRPRHAVAAVRAGRADPFHRGAAATEQEAVMAAGEVHLTIVGNLVDEPELRFTPSGVRWRSSVWCRHRGPSTGPATSGGTATASFSSATCGGERPSHAAESLEKGTRVIVRGRLRQRSAGLGMVGDRPAQDWQRHRVALAGGQPRANDGWHIPPNDRFTESIRDITICG